MTKPGEKLNSISPADYRKRWHEACRQLRYFPGPPHQLRHTGPSHDYITGYRTLEQSRVRGRWSAGGSTVQRYAKTHSYIEAQAKFPQNWLQQSAVELARVDKRADKAKG